MEEKESRRPTVHGAGNKRLDAVLDFVSFAAKPMPLVRLLDEAPRRIAAMFEADVCSLYVLEGDGHDLVMRGNVGFSNAALGQVRLRVGEGITGKAVEYLRPISAETAEQHAAYKYFSELKEERFPVFLAVPITGKSGALGALVVQRRRGAFVERDIELLTLLGALIAAGVRHAELVDSRREKAGPRVAGGGTRKVTLTGTPVLHGRVVGAIAALRRPPPHPSVPPADGRSSGEADVRTLRTAFETAEKSVRALTARASALELGEDAAFLRTYNDILADMRFRERAAEIAATGVGVSWALAQVAREATRTAVSFTRDAFLEERMRDVEDLCDALSILASPNVKTGLLSKALLIGDGLTVFDLLVSARAQPVGVALSERATGPRMRALLRLLGAPAIVDVHGLFRWAADGDIGLLDADHGIFIINPTKGEIASLREHRRSQTASSP